MLMTEGTDLFFTLFVKINLSPGLIVGLEAKGNFIANHNNTFYIRITVPVTKKIPGVHIPKMQLVREVIQESVYNP